MIDEQKIQMKIEAYQKKYHTFVSIVDHTIYVLMSIQQDAVKKKEQEEMGRAQIIQKKWFLIVTAFSRLAQVKNLLEVGGVKTSIHSFIMTMRRMNYNAYILT
jgi:hypothetical protein